MCDFRVYSPKVTSSVKEIQILITDSADLTDTQALAHAMAGMGVAVFQFHLCGNASVIAPTDTAIAMLQFFTNKTSYLKGSAEDCTAPANVPAASIFPAQHFFENYRRTPDLRVVAVGAAVMPVMQALQHGKFTDGVQVVGLATFNPLVPHSYFLDVLDLTNQPSMYAISTNVTAEDVACAGEDLDAPTDAIDLFGGVTPVPSIVVHDNVNTFWYASNATGTLLQCRPGNTDASVVRSYAATMVTLFFRTLAGDVPATPALYLDCVGVVSLLGLSLDVSC
jgi:hypothetical protein